MANNECIKRGKEAGQRYSMRKYEGNKEHTRGPPVFVHIFKAVLPELAKHEKVSRENQKNITEYMGKVSTEAMCDHIKMFKISKTFRSDIVTVQFAFGKYIYNEEERVPPWRRPPWRVSGDTSWSQPAKALRLAEVQASIIMALNSVGVKKSKQDMLESCKSHQ
eukprot:7755043-Heterocapsa_arctica.AAC.1